MACKLRSPVRKSPRLWAARGKWLPTGEHLVENNAKGEYVGDTKLTQLTIGLQLGGQAYSQIIFFEDKRAFDEFTGGNFEFGAQATAVAITAGASASSSTAGGSSAGAEGRASDRGDILH